MGQVGAVLGITRQRVGQIESGKGSLWVEPDRAIKLCRLLQIDMLDLCLAMGYPIRCPGADSPRDLQLLKGFHQAPPSVQEHVLRGFEAEI